MQLLYNTYFHTKFTVKSSGDMLYLIEHGPDRHKLLFYIKIWILIKNYKMICTMYLCLLSF